MTEVASRELRNDTRGVLRRVADGEEIVITVSGQPVALLTGVRSRPRWVRRDDFVARFEGIQADPALARELAELLPDTTDDLPL
jgi:prevent-host-death family protein